MKTAIVTGASGGVGLEVTRQLIDEGWQVYAQYRTSPGDIPEANWWKSSFPSLGYWPTLDRVDALIHCAGVCSLGKVSEAPMSDWHEAMEVNLYAPVELTSFYLPQLRESHGHVIYLNSGAGLRANPGWGSYAASKFAAKAWCDALRAEEPLIRVTGIHPGRIDTPMQEKIVASEGGSYDPDNYLSPVTVAQAVVNALLTPADAHPHEVTLRPRGKVTG